MTFTVHLFAQDFSKKDYSRCDSIGQFTKQKHRKVDELTDALVDSTMSQDEKARVIYAWIAYHIEYKNEKYGTDAEKILKRGFGVCEGYSALFDAMCTRAGVHTSFVTGYSKTKVTEIGKKYAKADHAWNAIYLNNTWYFIDATWGSGSYNKKEEEFTQKFEPAFFLASSEFFNLTHLAEDSMWAKISQQKTTVTEFYQTPLFYPAYNTMPELLCPKSNGVIQVREQDTIRIPVCFKPDNTDLYFYIKSGKVIGKANVIEKDNTYFIEVPLKKKVTTTLTIFCNDEPLFDMKLRNQ